MKQTNTEQEIKKDSLIIDFENKVVKILKEGINDIFKIKYSYYQEWNIKRIEKEIIFISRSEYGNQINSFGTYRHFKAIKNNKIIEELTTETGWKSPYSQTTYSEWKKEVLRNGK